MISRRFQMTGQTVAYRIPRVLERRGLDPAFRDWVMTSHGGRVWLFAEVAARRVDRLERYSDQKLLHQMSTVCDGIPVYLSNSNGLRYAFLLSQRPRLPVRAEFPGCKRGFMRLGVGVVGKPVTRRWKDLGNLLVGGMTGAGKSNFLRLLAYQGLAEGAQLLLSDIDRATFPMLAEHDALLADIAATPEEAREVVARGLAECDRRAALYQSVPGYPDKLSEYNAVADEPLPRVLVILDEYNATAIANGGARGNFCGDVAALAWRARKFGLTVVTAAQDFEKRIVGRMRDQMNAICFKIRSKELARAVGCIGAANIRPDLPGRAVTSEWGILQVYEFDKALLIGGGSILSDSEHALVTWALAENEGYLSLTDIQEHANLKPYATRQLASDWERRGWLVKDTEAKNRRRVTQELEGLVYKLQTLQSPTNSPANLQTDLQTDL